MLAIPHLVSRFIDVLIPPLCPACQKPVSHGKGLCGTCWQRLSFITTPYCACCGLPFDLASTAPLTCGACLARPHAFDTARAAVVYDDASKPLILGFKHADRTDMAPLFGQWLFRAGKAMLDDAHIVAPVPLHRWRLFRRRYNQSALLGRQVARDEQWIPDLLQRTRATPFQGHLSAKGRHRNVAGAFAVSPTQRARLLDRRVVLIDDVLTTGATVDSCARVLKQAGAARVDILTIARVVRQTTT